MPIATSKYGISPCSTLHAIHHHSIIQCTQDERIPDSEIEDILSTATSVGVVAFIVNGCWPGDWDHVAALASSHPHIIIPQFGLHPWWVGRTYIPHPPNTATNTNPPWLTALRTRLLSNPRAGLGECGLDKTPKALVSNPWEHQVDACRSQLILAQNLHRPVTVHCVRAFGALHSMLEELQLTVPVVVHAWTGSAEATKTLLLQFSNVFFSLGGHLLRGRVEKAVAMLQVLRTSLDRCLLESDAPDGVIVVSDEWRRQVLDGGDRGLGVGVKTAEMKKKNSDDDDVNTPCSVADMLKIVARAMNVSEEEVAARTTATAKRIFLTSFPPP